MVAGKSMGGRIASKCANEWFASGQISGRIYQGYPFHAFGKADVLSVDHLLQMRTPTLLIQGERPNGGIASLLTLFRSRSNFRFYGLSTVTTVLKHVRHPDERKKITGCSRSRLLINTSMDSLRD